MKLLGNIIWFIFGGLFAAIGWILVGLLFCITIIGIPIGKQCFKFVTLVITPFGKDVVTHFDKHPILNILWVIFFGWEMTVGYLIIGVFFIITILGIPFGLQWFKLAKLAFIPFGATIK